MANTVHARLLAPGGLATTECASDQQWDRPNGWAPLQWMGIHGLSAYGHGALAQDIAHRWLTTVAEVYEAEGKLVEKYALRELPCGEAHGGGGGEYPLQDGFGWTNGVTRALLAEHLEHAAHGARAHAHAAAYAGSSKN
jgi:alpha,alpha-trehalase